jgi:hypothetical protein
MIWASGIFTLWSHPLSLQESAVLNGHNKLTKQIRQENRRSAKAPRNYDQTSEIPDQTEVHPLSICPCGCGSDLSGQPVLGYESHQAFELPPHKLVDAEHRTEVKRCPFSEKLIHASWPVGVTVPVKYGPNYLGWLVYLNTQLFIPQGQDQLDEFRHLWATCQSRYQSQWHKTVSQELLPFSSVIKEQLPLELLVNG